MRIVLLGLAVLAAALPSVSAKIAATHRCQATKLLVAAQYNLCRAQADARAARSGAAAVYGRCDQRFLKQWARAEKRAAGACLTTGDEDDVQLATARYSETVAASLGTAPLGSSCSTASIPFSYSYMITNRAKPFATSRADIVPTAPGTLAFFTAPGAYQSQNPMANYVEVTQDVFLERLKADLAKATGSGSLHLGVYVHGLGNYLTDAMTETAQFGCNLAVTGGYPGLLIGFSWPSYGVFESGYYYATEGPPPPPLTPQRSGTIRDNILGSRSSFAAMVKLLEDQVIAGSRTPVELSFLTHSEGNYMLMVGMNTVDPVPHVQHCLMLAADISSVSLQQGEQGQAIADACANVTVYYSGADETIASSDYEFFQYHRQDYSTRLGLVGPHYLPDPAPLSVNVTGVDCSRVTQYPAVFSIVDVHSSYLSIAQILTDQTQTMLGQGFTKRSPIGGTTQGFRLQP
jgi:hypothetical protein